MTTRLVLLLWIFFFIYQFPIHWCEIINDLTSVDNVINIEDSTSNNYLTNIENLTSNANLTCIVSLTNVDDVTCTYHKQPALYDFGYELLENLPKDFPVSFQAHDDVNITKEKEYLLGIIEQFNLAEMYHDNIVNEAETNSTSDDEADENSSDDIIRNMVLQFSKYIEKSGKRGLKTLAYKVKNLVNPTLYLNHILKVPKYFAELEKYFNFIFKKKVRCEIDLQFVFLDMLQSSVKTFGKASEEICGIIVQEGNITLSLNQINAIEEAIGLAVFNEKKEAFNYICQRTYVCRRFPAYSDYFAKLLKSILKLQDNYFKIIVSIIKYTIKTKSEFLRSITDDKMAHNITLELEVIADNSYEVSSLMTLVIRHIMQRYKVFYINGVEIRNSTKAIRILIDLIDVTFQVSDENIIGTDIRELIKCISEWGRGKKRNAEKMLFDFLNDAIDFLNIYWNHEIRDEVKFLVQFIIKGSSDNDTLRDQLFTKGSKIGTDDHIIYAEYKNSDLAVEYEELYTTQDTLSS